MTLSCHLQFGETHYRAPQGRSGLEWTFRVTYARVPNQRERPVVVTQLQTSSAVSRSDVTGTVHTSIRCSSGPSDRGRSHETPAPIEVAETTWPSSTPQRLRPGRVRRSSPRTAEATEEPVATARHAPLVTICVPRTRSPWSATHAPNEASRLDPRRFPQPPAGTAARRSPAAQTPKPRRNEVSKGEPARTRTVDPRIKSPLLYQLSYEPVAA